MASNNVEIAMKQVISTGVWRMLDGSSVATLVSAGTTRAGLMAWHVMSFQPFVDELDKYSAALVAEGPTDIAAIARVATAAILDELEAHLQLSVGVQVEGLDESLSMG